VNASFPFSAVVGTDDAKLGLMLAAIDPALGGVLLRGQKGSAKSTLARGLAALLPGGAPFVELPLGATEDRVVGSIDLATALTGGGVRVRTGLIADAHGGVLYVDEVNLLPDHLVDVLLDVAASGVNRIERESVSHAHEARFVLVGSMNPEEGELRPQLLDRFGLCADVRTPADPSERAEAVARRLAHDADPAGFAGAWAPAEDALRSGLASARARSGGVALGEDLIRAIGALCASVGAEGLRADLVISRAAAARAALDGREEAGPADVRAVAALALAHRSRRSPFDEHGIDAETLWQAMDDALGGEGSAGDAQERVAPPDPPAAAAHLSVPRSASVAPAGGRRSVVEGPRGRLVGDREPGPGGPAAVAVGATVRAAVVSASFPKIEPADLREAVREAKAGNLVVFCVDASGSMGAPRRMEAAKGALLGLLLDAYERRDRVALVSFRDDDASVVLRPTGSVEVARARLASLPTGGRTPLAAGIETALRVARVSAGARRPLLVVVTDGRATAAAGGAEPVGAALAAGRAVRRAGVSAVVVDAEDVASEGAGARENGVRLGLARSLAEAMGARHLPLSDLSAGRLRALVRDG